MNQASAVVCFADSDSEDYVSMDEEDLNMGIQDLYNDSSASDAGSDISNDDYYDNNNNNNNNNNVANLLSLAKPIKNNEKEKKVLKKRKKQKKKRKRKMNKNKSKKKDNIQQQQQQQQPQSGIMGFFSGLLGAAPAHAPVPAPKLYHPLPPAAPLPSAAPVPAPSPSPSLAMPAPAPAPAPVPFAAPAPLGAPPPINNYNNLNASYAPILPSIPSFKSAHVPAPLPPRHSINDDDDSDDSDSDSDDDDDDYSSSSDSSSSSSPVKAGIKPSKIVKRIQKLNEMKQKRAVKKKKKNVDRKVFHKQKVNSNIISIELGTLKESANNIATGDAVTCSNDKCGAILSKYDKLLKKHDDIKLDDDDESIWICKFCNNINVIEIDDAEFPNNETIDYMLEPPDDNKTVDDDCKQIIFCIDISGSMCVTQPIEGQVINLKGNRLKKDQDDLAQFMDPLDRNQWMPNQSQNVTYISRLQSVQAAVDKQLEDINKNHPNYKIGLVTFNNEVSVYNYKDDDNKTNTIITGDKLNNLNKLKEIGESSECKINSSISSSYKYLSDSLWSLETTGQTALGPALTVSIGMASAAKGSTVILCTDGLANVGVGNIDDNNNDNDNDNISSFYSSLGQYAMSKGVVINIISITDNGCKLENLGKIVDITNGNLRRINPLKLHEKFAGILQKEIIAAMATAKMLLHPGLMFVDTVNQLQNLNPFQQQQQQQQIIIDQDKDKDVVDKSKKDQDKDKKVINNNIKSDMDVDNNDNDDNDDNDNDKDNDVVIKNKQRDIYPIDKLLREVGNVFSDTTIFFEYGIRKEKRNNFLTLKKLPFQVHINYNKLDGTKMLRVITQEKDITFNKKKVRQNLDYKILSKFNTRVTTKLCKIGDYEASRAWTNANVRYMHNNANNNDQLYHVASHVNSNVALDYQMQQQVQTEMVNNNNNNNNNNNMNMNNMNMNNAAPMNFNARYNNNNNNNNMFRSYGQQAPAQAQAQAPQQQQQKQTSSISSWSWRGNTNNKSRKNKRNDKFSSLQYGMGKK